MKYEAVVYDVESNIATITLNRPQRLNALSDEMTRELFEAMQSAARDSGVRVIVLTGAGRGFCAGGDISGFGGQTPQELTTKLPRHFDMNQRADFQTRHSYFPAIPKPIIGMINGPAAGLGMLYALFCDIRFASSDAVFSTSFARRGVGAEYGMAWILSTVVGHARALDLLLSARKVDGTEAADMGLVNKAYPASELRKATYAYAQELVNWCAPSSMRLMKKQAYEVPFQDLHQAVIMANQEMLTTNTSADFFEGTASFREKRPPRFQSE